MIHLQLLIAVRHPNVVQHSAAPQFIDAVIILLGMRHLHKLKSVRLMLQMNAVHTIHTPRSGNTGGFQNRGAVLLAAFNNVPIDGSIGNAGHFQIPQNIFFQPERKGLAERPLALEAVTAKLDPGLLPQLAFAGQDTRNRVPPRLPFKFVQRRFFHVVTTPCRNLEGSVQKVFVILAVVDRLFSVLVQQFSIEPCQTVRLSLSCAVDNIRNLFGDDRIAVLLKNLSERIARAKPDMYPLYWTPSRGGIIMRYTYEYKRKCVELYREGKWPETPEGVSDKSFRDKVRLWVRAEDSRGPEALKHKNFNRNWTPEERLELVSQVMSGKSCVSVAIEAGIQDRLLYQWVQNYKTKGYNGLVEMKKGRPSKGVPQMKKEEARPLNESEREELIRLRAENEYIKAENEVIKKEIALREERHAAQLKARKQRSSKSCVKKDTN